MTFWFVMHEDGSGRGVKVETFGLSGVGGSGRRGVWVRWELVVLVRVNWVLLAGVMGKCGAWWLVGGLRVVCGWFGPSPLEGKKFSH